MHKNFIVVFNDTQLKDNDEKVLDKLRSALSKNINVECRVPPSSGVIKVKPGDVVLLDETDNLLLDKAVSIVSSTLDQKK